MVIDEVLEIPVIGRLIRHRFVKFCTVGFSGMIINLAALFMCQEILFENIRPEYLIANIISIVIAAILNYLLNDIWTFAIRKQLSGHNS